MSHRFLFLLVGPILLTAAPLHADDAEEKAAEEVYKLGGKVDVGTLDSKDSAVGIVGVDLSNTKTTNEELKALTSLKNLRSLDLSGTQVTGAGFKTLAALKKLETLSLGGCLEVSDEELKELAVLERLQSLNIIARLCRTRGILKCCG